MAWSRVPSEGGFAHIMHELNHSRYQTVMKKSAESQDGRNWIWTWFGELSTFLPGAVFLTGMFMPVHVAATDLDPLVVGSWPGFTRGPARDVAVAGEYAYVVAGGLHVFDVSDPGNPQRIRGYETGGSPSGIELSGSFVYVVGEACFQLYKRNTCNIGQTCPCLGGNY